MKNIILLLAIGMLAACNDGAASTENAIDSTAGATVDSIQHKNDSLETTLDSSKADQTDSVKASTAKPAK